VISTDRSPRVYGESTESTRIVLRALQDSWVQIRDRQDALLLTRVLRAGDTYFVPARDGLTLLTGNAGGIEIRVDGVPVPPIGPVGTVRRQIALDPARLLSGTAAPR
jgi:cytoskeleton protein RodZ